MAIELWRSQVVQTKKVPAQQFGSETARTVGNAISGVGSALEQAGDQVQQKAELMRRTNVANQFDKARIESNKELMKLKFEADQDQDYENMRTKYANKLGEIKANINGMITEPEAKQRFNNDFDYDAGMTEINIAKSQQDKMIEQKKALYLESMDADMNTFYNTDNPKEKAIIRQRMLSRIDEHQQIGVIRPDVAVQAKISLRKELDEGNVQYDIDRDPAKAIANLDNGLYKNLNKKDRADLKDKALSAIRRNQIINEEQIKQVHQENNRLMTVKALDKQLTRQEIRNALNANQISVSNAENLIKNLESEKAVKASDDLKLWSELNSKTLNTDYDRNKLEYEILDANNKGLLKDTTAKSLLDKSANIEDKADTRLIKLNNTGLKVWATESGVLEDEKDMLEFNIEKRINEENPQGKDAINAIYQDEKDKLLRKLHPEIAPLDKTPNTIYLDRKFNDVTNITQPSKPNYVYDTEQNKLIPNRAEADLYTVYVPKKSVTIGFNQKPDAKQMHDVIQKEFYPREFNKRQIKKVKQYFDSQPEMMDRSFDEYGNVTSTPDDTGENIIPRENIIYQPKTTIGQTLLDAGKWAQTAIENAGLKAIESLTTTPIKAVGGISDIVVERNKERLLKIYEMAGQEPPQDLLNQPENQGAQLATDINKTISRQVGGFDLLNKYAQPNTDLDYGQQFAGKLGAGAGSMAMFLGASLLTGGTATAPALIAGLQQAGLKYTESKEKGKTPEQARGISLESGLVEGGLEGLGFNFLLKKYGGTVASTAIRAFSEGIQETLQTAGEQAIDVTAGLRKNPSMKELIQEQFESFVIGSLIGAPTSLAVTNAERSGFIPELMEMGFTKGQSRHIVNKMVVEARTITDEAVNAELDKIDSGETKPLIDITDIEPPTQQPIAEPEQPQAINQEFNLEAQIYNYKYKDENKNIVDGYGVKENDNGIGDPLFKTKIEAIDYIIKRDKIEKSNKEYREKEDKIRKEKEFETIEREKYLTTYLSNKKPIDAGKIKSKLSEKTHMTPNGKFISGERFSVLEQLYNDGWDSFTEQVPSIKEVTARRYNIMTAKQQEEYNAKVAENRTKLLYKIKKDGISYTVTKTEYDYFNYLKTAQIKQPQTSTEQNKDSRALMNPNEQLDNDFYNWFKNSKVVDVKGKPLVVYHGGAENINVFDLKYLGKQGFSEGAGFYFTDSKKIAQGYADTYKEKNAGKTGSLYKVFLNIKKPITSLDQKKITKKQLRNVFEELYKINQDALSNYGDIEYEGMNNVLNNAVNSEYIDTPDIDIIASLGNAGIADRQTINDVFTKITGYDGVILNDSWVKNKGYGDYLFVAFNPSQIKPISAQEPTIPQTDDTSRALMSGKWNVDMPTVAQTNKTVNKTQIIKFVEDNFGMPVKSLKPVKRQFKAGANAIYQRYQKLASLQNWGEIEPLTHELAHYIDDAEAQVRGTDWLNNLEPDIVNELKGLDYDKTEQRPYEGFAEFMRYYLTTDTAQQKAPKFYDYFNNEMLAKDAKLNKNISGLKDMVSTWQKQGSKNRFLAQIDFKGEHREVPFATKMQLAKSKIITTMIDELYPLQKTTEIIESKLGRKLLPSENPFAVATWLKSKSNETARSWVLDKPVDLDGNVIEGVKSMSEIFAPILKGEKLNLINASKSESVLNFVMYATAKRAELYKQQGLESGFDTKDVNFIINEFKSPVFDQALEDITNFFDAQLGLLVKNGVLSESQKDTIRQLNPIYIPLKRAFFDAGLSGISSGRIANSGQGILKRTGGSRPIINPIETMIAQTKSMMDRIAKAKIGKTVMELEELGSGLGDIIRPADIPKQATSFNISEIKQQLKDLKIDASEADLDAVLTVFDNKPVYNGKENVVSFWKDGKRSFYEIHKDLYDVLDNFGIEKTKGNIIKLAGKFAKLKRLGATGTDVIFAGRNFFKDSLETWAYSKAGVNPIDTVKSFYRTITGKQTDLELRLKRAGITMSGFVGQDRKQIAPLIDEMLLQNLGVKGKTLQVAKHPIDAITGLIAFTEIVNRNAEFVKSYEKLSNEHPDWSEEDVFIESFNRAQDVTVNFTRSGQSGKYINSISAFYNAGLQGKSKLFREIKNNPASFVAKGLSYIMPLALYSWWQNKDKDWYVNLPLDYKYSNLFFEYGDTVYRLGLPYDVGALFGELPVSIADSLHNADIKTDKQLLRLRDSFYADITSIIPNPDAIQPMYQIWRNKNYFGAPIESKGMQFQPTILRARPDTPELYKSLSKGFDSMGLKYSPIQLDYIVNGYTGGMVKKLSPLAQGGVPFVNSLKLNNKTYPSRQVSNFFEDYIPLSEKNNAKTLTRDEALKFEKIKPMYKTFTEINKMIKDSIEKKDDINRERINKRLKEKLSQYGYK